VLTLPLIPLIALALGLPPSQIGIVAGIPPVLSGMVLLTISLRRRRVALEHEVARRVAAEFLLRETNTKLELRVTERTADLQELVPGLEAFNRSVPHDLKDPLSGIADLARLAHDSLSKGGPDLALRSLPVIAKQADTSTRLVTTLLELARVGSTPLRYDRIRLSDLVEETFDSIRLTAKGPLPVFSCSDLPEVVADASFDGPWSALGVESGRPPTRMPGCRSTSASPQVATDVVLTADVPASERKAPPRESVLSSTQN
jgi:signal transduction histidine kinase